MFEQQKLCSKLGIRLLGIFPSKQINNYTTDKRLNQMQWLFSLFEF